MLRQIEAKLYPNQLIRKNFIMAHIYFDMDGVLAKYEREAYIPIDKPDSSKNADKNAVKGEEPLRPFEIPGRHYFRYVKPDNRIINVLSHLIDDGEYGIQKQNVNIHIISTLSKKGSLFVEQYNDKVNWIKEHIPNMPASEFYPALGEKRDIAVLLRNHRLDPSDILIDDYDVNLNSWRNAGGMAIKYLNGTNSLTHWKGPYFDQSMTSSDMINMLRTIANSYHSFNENDTPKPTPVTIDNTLPVKVEVSTKGSFSVTNGL